MAHLLFVGDPHGLHHHIAEEIVAHPAEACVLLGDQCYEEPIDHLFADVAALSKLRWIHGNHDTDRPGWYQNLFDSPWHKTCSLDARSENFSGVRVAGLGGVFRGKIWHPEIDKKYLSRSIWKQVHPSKHFAPGARKNESSIWPEDYDRLMMQEADILVTHEAPSCHRNGFAVLDELAEMLGARLIVHGHHHQQYSDVLANGIAVVGLGLAQTARFDMDKFAAATSAEQVISAFEFGAIAKRDGGWLR
ncbi:MAG: metallophosphoesterase [Mariprofundaceae bacterium]